VGGEYRGGVSGGRDHNIYIQYIYIIYIYIYTSTAAQNDQCTIMIQ